MSNNSCSCQQNPPVVIPPVSPFVCPDECCAQILASTCLIYDGPDIPAFGITTNQSLTQVVQNLAFGLGGEGGPSPLYQGPQYSTVTVNNIPAGTYIYGMSYDQLLSNIYAPYIHPTFSSFSMNQSVNVLVGTVISGTKTFTATYNNIGNVVPNSLKIINNDTQVVLAENLPISTVNLNIGSYTSNVASSLSFKGIALKTLNNDPFESELFTINWMHQVFVGQSNVEVLNSDDALTLTIYNDLKNDSAGIYTMTMPINTTSYKYFCFPDEFGSPLEIKDFNTGIAISLADSSANSFYNLIDSSGFPYGILYINVSNSITVPYRVYRSYYKLGGTYKIVIK